MENKMRRISLTGLTLLLLVGIVTVFCWQTTGTGAVEVLYRWLNAQNQVIATSNPAVLSQDVNPGASATVTVPVQAPTRGGPYTLETGCNHHTNPAQSLLLCGGIYGLWHDRDPVP